VSTAMDRSAVSSTLRPPAGPRRRVPGRRYNAVDRRARHGAVGIWIPATADIFPRWPRLGLELNPESIGASGQRAVTMAVYARKADALAGCVGQGHNARALNLRMKTSAGSRGQTGFWALSVMASATI